MNDASRLWMFLALSWVFFSGITIYQYHAYEGTAGTGDQILWDNRSDLKVWEQRVSPVPIELIIIAMGALYHLVMPYLVSKIYVNIYGTAMTKQIPIYALLFILTPYGLFVSTGAYAQLTAIALATVLLYVGLSKRWWIYASLTVPLIYTHSSGLILIGIVSSMLLVKEKKYYPAIAVLILCIAIPSLVATPRQLYGYELTYTTNHQQSIDTVSFPSTWIYFSTSQAGSILGLYNQAWLSLGLILGILLFKQKDRPLYLNYFLLLMFGVFATSLIGSGAIIRGIALLYVWFPLMIPERSVKNE